MGQWRARNKSKGLKRIETESCKFSLNQPSNPQVVVGSHYLGFRTVNLVQNRTRRAFLNGPSLLANYLHTLWLAAVLLLHDLLTHH